MRMKKLISAFLAIGTIVSSIAISTYAATPISKVTEEVVFDQSFGGLNGASDLSDFNVTGTWNYFTSYIAQRGNYNCNGGVITKEKYDLSEYSHWTYEVNMISNANGYNIYLGYDEAAGKGYRLYWHNGNDSYDPRLELYKAGDTENYVAQKVLSSLFGADVNYTVSFSNNLLSISQNGAEVISYEVTADEFNGKFGVQGQAASMIILMDMKLTKGRGNTANFWTYEEEFDGETVESLSEKGWTLPDTASIVNGTDSYINMTKNATIKFAPYGSKLSGNYAIKAKQKIGYNPHLTYVTIKGSDGSYYRIIPQEVKGGSESKLIKYDALTKTTTPLDIEACSISAYCYYTYDIKVYSSENETRIKADIYVNSSTTPITLEATDTNTPISSGNIEFYWANSDQRRLYNFSAYSIVDESEKQAVSFDKEIIDKAFTSDDNYTTITKDGFYGAREKAYHYGIKQYPTYSDENGMRYNAGNVYYYYDGIASDYSIETDMYRKYNNSFLRFNMSADGKSYYALESSYRNAGKYIKLYKVDSTGTTVFQEIGNIGYSALGAETWSNYKVVCDYMEDGSLKITAYFQGQNNEVQTLTGEDKTPLVGKDINLYPGDEGHIKRFRVAIPTVETDVEGSMPVFNPRFYNADGKAITRIEEGAVYAKSFAMLLNDHTITAAIYEDGIMTRIKNVNPFELSSKLKLFDVTDAENTEIKLFVFDNGKDLNKVVTTIVLN